MPSWWGKSSSEEAKKKASKESIIDTLHRKFKIQFDGKVCSRSSGSCRQCSGIILEKGYQSPIGSGSPSPSKHVSRCQSFTERLHAQPLPHPSLNPSSIGCTNSSISVSPKPRLENGSKPSLFLPLPRPACI